MSFYKSFCYLVWSTKYRLALLTPDVEPLAHNILRSKALQLGAIVYALNGTEDHVHMVVTMPRPMSAPDFVGQIKGVTSFRLNQHANRSVVFAWQNEFGLFTFDEKRLPPHIRYVEYQKEHHAQNNTIPILERTEERPTPHTLHEAPLDYKMDDVDWWNEMLALE